MRRREAWVGGVILAVALLVFFLTRDFPAFRARGVTLPGPSFFPNFIAGLLVLCAAMQFARAYREGRAATTAGEDRGDDDAAEESSEAHGGTSPWAGLLTILVLLVGGVLYGLFLEAIGFQLLTFVCCTIVMLCFRVRAPRALLYSGILVIVMTLVFERLFRVPLPYGIFHL